MIRRVSCFFLIFVFFVLSLNVYAECLKEGDHVTFSGVVSKKLFYGPPNFGEDKEHDKKLFEWILHLNKPLTCVIDANTDQLGWNKNIQLILKDINDYKKESNFLGVKINVTGDISLQETGYHVTSVLLDNTSFKVDSK
ncbi:DUF4431 domain-containing protein [Pluralibacter gergoviae]|nr:DUF4431 domain-containing protein [Pluralibacter gergoviae]ELC3019955.1 DUF4431 domain-containing protein [Pluralibacter gergoviae]ELC3024961.1 DUF4431 domain-containing protein [Pluralibacter gergoviae]